VTNPLKPKKLIEGFGDTTVRGQSQRHANQVHSAFGWQEGRRAFVVMNDDEEYPDVDILEITNPSKPKLIAEYDLRTHSEQARGAVNGDAVFLHDMVVKKIDGRQIMLLSYWDGGYIQMDVTDPANATVVGDTDYAATDPLQPTFTPEGNAHQAEFTRDNQHFIATDEDFDPYRVTATLVDGPYAGRRATATQGSGTPQIDEQTDLSGGTRAVGLACPGGMIPAPDSTHTIAVIERGVCDFTAKIATVEEAGYDAAIVFNRTGVDGCEALINMLADGGIPALFVSRTDGFRILGASLHDYTCSDGEAASGTTAPAAGTDGATVDLGAVFDGWGYVHLFDADTFADLDQYAIPESQDPDFADGFGDLSVHEVATDPDEDLAYLSYYTGGLRVLEYASGELVEVGAFIAEGGNNFWGVEVHKHPNGQKYILASDRDSGLWIFQYKP
ncbi:MAG: hypothetical protein Q8K58_06830, partial [Acidimicrobiales bacterium]|nr:hypothetical protein [Acidimicrobiales bacterium]